MTDDTMCCPSNIPLVVLTELAPRKFDRLIACAVWHRCEALARVLVDVGWARAWREAATAPIPNAKAWARETREQEPGR